MEEKIKKLKNEFYFYQSDISYYHDLVQKNSDLPISKLRTIIINSMNISLQKKDYGWLISYFDDIGYYSKKEGLIILTKKLNTLRHYSITIDLNILEYLLNNCLNLNSFLENIFASYEIISENTINKMTSNANVALFLYSYAFIKNLFSKEELSIPKGTDFVHELKKIPVMPKEEQNIRFQQIAEDKIIIANSKASLEDKKQAQARIEANKEAILRGNLRLIFKPASKYASPSLSFDDLFQEGYFGLNKAVDKFSLDKNSAFSTYALWWIEESIGSYVKNNGNGNLIKVPYRINKIFLQYKNYFNTLSLELGRNPTEAEIAEKMGISEKNLREYLLVIDRNKPALNIDLDSKHDGENNQRPLENLIPSDEDIFEEVSNNILTEKFNEILSNKLNLREEYVIRMRLGVPHIDSNQDKEEFHSVHTLEEIGQALNLTREGVRQIEARALRKLRSPQILKFLEPYSSISVNEEDYRPFWANFKGINSEDVILAIHTLSQDEQDTLYRLYGSDLTNENITFTPYEYHKRGELVRKIKLNIPNFATSINNDEPAKMFITDFLHCSWEQVQYLTDYLDLSKPIYELLIKLFGTDFKEPYNVLNLTMKEQNIFNEWLQDMNILLRLINFINKTFEQFFSCTNEKKYIFLKENRQNPKYRLIFLLWGEDLNHKLTNNYLASDLKEEFIILYKEIKEKLSLIKLSQYSRKIYNVLNTSVTQMKKIRSIILNSLQYRDLFIKIYGDNLNGEENLTNLANDELIMYNNSLMEIETILKNRSNRKIWIVLGISPNRFSELKDLIFNNPNYKKIFQKVYGIDLLDKQNMENLSLEEERQYYLYLEEIKNYLRNSIDKKLYKILGTSARTMDKLRKIILNSPQYKDLFVKIYGNELANGENLDNLPEEEIKLYYEYLKEIKDYFLNLNFNSKQEDLEKRVKYYLAEKEQISQNNKVLLEDLLWQDFLIPNNYEEYFKLENGFIDTEFAKLVELLPIEYRLITKFRLGMNQDRQIYSIAQIAQVSNLPIDYITKIVNQGLAYLNIMCKDYEKIYNYNFFSQDVTLKRKKEELKRGLDVNE